MNLRFVPLLTALRWAALLASLFLQPRLLRTQALRVQSGVVRFRPGPIHPNLVCVLCTLTVSATPTAVTFALVKGGTAVASAPIVITTTLYGVSALGSLSLYAYFNSASAALTNGYSTPSNIASSLVLGVDPNGLPTSYMPFTQSDAVGTPGATLELFSTASLLSLGCNPAGASCRTDNLTLEIQLATLPQLPAGTYTGTLILQAQAM
jgi:hypothetical protein